MKRTLKVAVVICMLTGLCIRPCVSKSQSIQEVTNISFLFNMNYTSNFLDDDSILMQTEYIKTDSSKTNNDFSQKKNSAKDKINPLRIQTSEKIIKRKSYRNKPGTIQIRI